MKLRNKPEYIGEEKPKGRVGTLIGYSDSHKAIVVEFEGEDGGTITSLYRSLAELNEEWEDYTPQEPLIKDEKIRKVVRAWAEANHIDKVAFRRCHTCDGCSFIGNYLCLQLVCSLWKLKDGQEYTIDELCGEEE